MPSLAKLNLAGKSQFQRVFFPVVARNSKIRTCPLSTFVARKHNALAANRIETLAFMARYKIRHSRSRSDFQFSNLDSVPHSYSSNRKGTTFQFGVAPVGCASATRNALKNPKQNAWRNNSPCPGSPPGFRILSPLSFDA